MSGGSGHSGEVLKSQTRLPNIVWWKRSLAKALEYGKLGWISRGKSHVQYTWNWNVELVNTPRLNLVDMFCTYIYSKSVLLHLRIANALHASTIALRFLSIFGWKNTTSKVNLRTLMIFLFQKTRYGTPSNNWLLVLIFNTTGRKSLRAKTQVTRAMCFAKMGALTLGCHSWGSSTSFVILQSGSDITLKINVEFQQTWSKSTAPSPFCLSPQPCPKPWAAATTKRSAAMPKSSWCD